MYGSLKRGLYPLANRATEGFERARSTVQHFINAENEQEIIFTSGATSSINVVANGLAHLFEPGYNVVISQMEHHANYLPWMELASRTGAELRVMPMGTDGTLDLDKGLLLIDRLTKMVAVTQLSNVLGVVTPLEAIISVARKMNTLILVDAAQSIGRMPVDVQALDCDFLVFSGHKLYGPTGIGILYGKREVLQSLRPSKFGGGMVGQVHQQSADYLGIPHRLEAGTQHMAGALGLGAAIQFLQELGIDKVHSHAAEITHYLADMLGVAGATVLANTVPKLGCVSFALEGIHPHDAATILAERHICLRAGHHCAQPLHEAMGMPATLRASIGIYTDKKDVDELILGIQQVKKVFS